MQRDTAQFMIVTPSLWKAWIAAVRIPTLLVGLSPVLMGLALVWQQMGAQAGEASLGLNFELRDQVIFDWRLALAAAGLVILLQTAANLVNDAKDAEKGIDTADRIGPVRVVQAGWISHRAMKRAYLLCFLLAAGLAGLLYWQAGDRLTLAVAALCATVAYLYTAGPFPLAYYAMGEGLALVFFGPIAVMGTVYLQTHQLDPYAAVWGLAPGLLAAAIMATNNARDQQGDALAGKHTLATIFGSRWARRLPLVCLWIAALFYPLYGAFHGKLLLAFSVFLLFALAIDRLIKPLLAAGRFNQALKATAIANIGFALGFTVLVTA